MRASLSVSLVPLFLLLTACGERADVSLYVALDQEHSQALVRRFEQQSGLAVKTRFDTEASKTVGLVSAIVEEAGRPRCDVFWNNELAHTVRLAQKGLLAPYDSPSAAKIPAQWRDAKGMWVGFAARARVLIVNKDLLPDPKDWPTSMFDLVDPKWQGRCGLARPLTGTTLTHLTAVSLLLGEERFGKFVDGIFSNEVVLLQSNGATMKQVAEGKLAWAFTDTDDYHVAKTKGHPVACVFPDQGEGQIGTMLIPNSVALIKGGPDPVGAKKLIDKILDAETEALLAAAAGAQIPLRPGVRGPLDVSIPPIGKFRALAWDVAWTGENLARCSQDFGKRFGL